MGYIVEQYNKSDTEDVSKFMSFVIDGEPIRVPERSDTGIMGIKTSNPFFNEGVKVSLLEASKNYYFHGKIKRNISETQVFYIYLINQQDTSLTANQQFLKTITIQSGTGWVDIELIFTPFVNFDTILFKLQRSVVDYDANTCRYPTIIYQELSEINNLLTSFNIKSLYKIGVQSRPGFLMCINGEEIRTGKSGIYELKDGFITINFFSAVAAAKDPDNLQQLMDTLIDSTYTNSSSTCLFNKNKTRIIDNFSLDYVYKGGIA